MTFENFSRLTNATLLNTPAIYSFENIEINPKKIKHGDLFIGDNREEIELALQNGAYGVVSTIKQNISDEEIAWFIVDSLDELLIKLLRFNLVKRDFQFIYAHTVEIELIKKIANRENMIFLSNNEKDNYKKIINADKKSYIFSTNKIFLQKIYPEFGKIYSSETKLFKSIKHSLFLSDFKYKEIFYKNIKIPHIFLKYLENVINFLEKNSIEYNINKTSYTSHFYPIFVNKNLDIKSFGKSDHVLICESEKELIKEELDYLKKEATWAKIIEVNIAKLSDIEKLKDIEFNFAIISVNYAKLIEFLEKKEKKRQIELF